MALILTLLIIMLLLIFPIPMKTKISFNEGIFKLKIFNLNIFSSNNGIENKLLKKLINKTNIDFKKETTIKYKNKKAIKPSPLKRKKIIKKISIRKLYSNISCNKFKPLIKIDGDLTFGIDDAAYCAILYGLLCNIPTLLRLILEKAFKVNDIKLNIIPKFNTNTIYFGITSIFYFNVANIIYILYLMYKSFEIEEVTPE
ncbi:MAG: DUF2953 domain-containing protein [Clostridium sp.]|jgi:Protein of unknown function (DUF2953)|nr:MULTISPECIES: DUF2953 domain-containing protein [Clostridium]MBS5308318.1 DUF2953 domain-containing protein [Clostridium sp.]MDB1944027.1 DUF2953 domain-containing protein [Clostridium tertium]MDB1950808.1 DUF2953 domain-containing protein [Clostridium tertium]MDU1278365.1 DUF2953 domain-containing protein [Clostridium sp.]MDU2460567.1 DUF2953 domain-containing protein [Clostridium sp.]